MVPQTAKNVAHLFSMKAMKLSVTPETNYVQFWFRRFRSDIFDVKHAPRTGRPVVDNIDKITEIIEIDRHVSSRKRAKD
ncbi:hypothetical protein TNCV_1158931 [Trichonephila clavipes]|nr:hypothetical protein TNCV_1158931 [Trichonephila clavipes]